MKKRNHLILAFTLAISIPSARALAHAGHEREGLPAGLHGGKVEMVKGIATSEGHEVYLEETVEGGSLKIYPVTLKKGATEFSLVSPKTEFSNVEVKVEYPRSKKTEKLSVAVKDDVIEASLIPKEPNRFLIHVSATYHSKKGTAKTQFEGQ